MADHDGEVAAAVRDEGERVAGVERQRRQHRKDLAPKILREVRPDRVGVLVRLEEPDAMLFERRAERFPPAGRLILHQPRGAAANRGELLRGRETVGRQVLRPGALLLQQRRDAHHVELVEVRRDDGQEFHALEQRVIVRGRLIEHALVELEPAQLAVDVARRIAQVARRRLDRSGKWAD
jgi:hypothetical protein